MAAQGEHLAHGYRHLCWLISWTMCSTHLPPSLAADMRRLKPVRKLPMMARSCVVGTMYWFEVKSIYNSLASNHLTLPRPEAAGPELAPQASTAFTGAAILLALVVFLASPANSIWRHLAAPKSPSIADQQHPLEWKLQPFGSSN